MESPNAKRSPSSKFDTWSEEGREKWAQVRGKWWHLIENSLAANPICYRFGLPWFENGLCPLLFFLLVTNPQDLKREHTTRLQFALRCEMIALGARLTHIWYFWQRGPQKSINCSTHIAYAWGISMPTGNSSCHSSNQVWLFSFRF